MSTITAYMLIGQGHPNHDGIWPKHLATLSENSRPTWSLWQWEGDRRAGVDWNPTVEHMLEDGLLLVGLRAIEHPVLVAKADPALLTNAAGLYDLDQEILAALRSECRSLEGYKIVLTVLEGSSIRDQLPILEDYAVDVEVCPAVFSRIWSRWSEETVVTGSLQPTEKIDDRHQG